MPLNYKTFALLLLLSFSAETFSWEKEEHQMLADLVFDSTLAFCGINFNDSLIFLPWRTGFISVNQNFGITNRLEVYLLFSLKTIFLNHILN